MISYTATFTSSAPLDLFQGNSPTGKWVVRFLLSGNSSAALSEDGTTVGQALQVLGTGNLNPYYQFVVEDQPLYIINTFGTTNTITANVTILPVVASDVDVNLGLC